MHWQDPEQVANASGVRHAHKAAVWSHQTLVGLHGFPRMENVGCPNGVPQLDMLPFGT
jgi:hypothetical protein